jgi:hypothetical protein
MLALPHVARPLLERFSGAFTQPTFQRVLVLLVGAILTMGRRTVTHMLWTLRSLAPGHYTSYHRVWSCRVWSLWPLAKVLATMVLALIPPAEPVLVALDDTSPQHKGKHVYGKGRHHDACRSSHSHIVWVWGHKWVVLAALVKFSWAARPWALPVLVALYRPEELNTKEGRRHKTPPQLARGLLAVLIHWFPQRKFIALGDGGFSSHELARFAASHSRHLTLIGRLHPQARLYAPPPKTPAKTGRPRIKGRRLAKPQDKVQRVGELGRTLATVPWYGGATRAISYLSATGLWYKSGHGTVPLRWAFVQDQEGTHRSEYFFCTDPAMTPVSLIGGFTGRWSIEVTFQEVRFHLGFGTLRSWCKNSVLRAGPCLLGLFSVVCLLFHEHLRSHQVRMERTSWYAKTEPTFADALATVRGLFWQETVFARPAHHQAFQKLPAPLRHLLLGQLARTG